MLSQAIRGCVFSGLIASFLTPNLPAEEAETTKTVLAVWRKREEATHSLRCEIIEENIRGKDVNPPVAEDFKATLKLSLLTDGNRMRYTRSGMRFLGTEIPVNQEYTSVFDGEVAKSLYVFPKAEDTLRKQGYVSLRKHHYDQQSLYILPILWYFKPLSLGSATLKPERWHLVRKEKLEGVECLVFEDPKDETNSRLRHFWIAPDRDMAIMRYTSTIVQRRMLDGELDITFAPDGKGGWALASWNASAFGVREDKGMATQYLQASGSSRLVSIKTNVDVPQEMFDIKFPTGTEVNDHREKKQYIVK